MSERCGIDTGGTFTDLVLIGDDGSVEVRKTLSTPPNFEAGVLDAVRMISAAESEGGVGTVPATIAHGTTVGTNAVIEANIEPVALLTTAGFADIIPQMRGSGRVAGLPDEEVINLHETSKPEPLVTPDLIFEIDERMDCFGDEVVALNEAAVESAVAEIVERGITAVAESALPLELPQHRPRGGCARGGAPGRPRFARLDLQRRRPALRASTSASSRPCSTRRCNRS